MQTDKDINDPGKPISKTTQDLPGGRLNPSAFRRTKHTGTESVESLAEKIKSGDTSALSRGITLIESNKVTDKPLARLLIRLCLRDRQDTARIAISGSPGAGKSTFIEAIGTYVADQGHKVAVLAIDPSSSLTGGSILGDKTRMEKLSAHPNAYIRPTPAGKTLGGVARYTREAIILCEAAGYNVIFIETVGVGQSETIAESMVDIFTLLLLPGAGDELQGIKRGVVEMADLIVVNKADGERIQLASQAKIAYQRALHLFPPKESGSTVEVFICSSTEDKGTGTIWQHITDMLSTHRTTGYFAQRRQQQLMHWFDASIRNNIFEIFLRNNDIHSEFEALKQAILNHQITPFDAADQLLARFFKDKS